MVLKQGQLCVPHPHPRDMWQCLNSCLAALPWTGGAPGIQRVEVRRLLHCAVQSTLLTTQRRTQPRTSTVLLGRNPRKRHDYNAGLSRSQGHRVGKRGCQTRNGKMGICESREWRSCTGSRQTCCEPVLQPQESWLRGAGPLETWLIDTYGLEDFK